MPTPTQTQRRRQAETPDEDGDVDVEENQSSGSGSIERLSKSLVRYALSCEFARKPIKRQDVNEKGESVVCMAVSSADNGSTWIIHTVIQISVRSSQQRAHGRLWHELG